MELFLIAHIAGRAVAVAADQIDSVVDIGEIVAVPRADPCVCGLVALRSRVVTVIDTRIALGLAAAGTGPGTRRAIISRIDGHHYAVLVDALEDVAPFERQPLSSGLALERGWSMAGTGMVEREGEPVLVVDLAALVPGQPVAVAA